MYVCVTHAMFCKVKNNITRMLFCFKMLTNITQMLMGPISLMMVGHLDDPVQFGAASLAMSVSIYFANDKTLPKGNTQPLA